MSTPDAPDAPLPNARYNFAILVGDVTFFIIGSAFLDTATALPALVGRLGGDLGLLGLMGALRQGAYYLPQLFIAHYLQNAKQYKPVMLFVTFFGRLGYVLAGAAILTFGKSRPELALAALVTAYGVGWLADGCGGVPWTALISRTIPARQRGALFAATQTISGVGKLGVAPLIALLLGGGVVLFPVGDALLVWGCAAGLSVSWLFLLMIREPKPELSLPDAVATDVPKLALGAFLASLPKRLRDRPDFARLALVQVLATASVATAPFLWGYVRTATPGGISAGDAGKFLVAQTVGLLMFAPVWGTLSDKWGPKRTLTLLLGVSLSWPLLAFLGAATGGSVLAFYAAYFVLGGVLENWITITNYLLESVPQDDQPTYIALMNAVSLPALLLPLIAGQFAQSLGAGAALGFASLLLAGGLLVARTLPDTR